jgi:hypothetical protein
LPRCAIGPVNGAAWPIFTTVASLAPLALAGTADAAIVADAAVLASPSFLLQHPVDITTAAAIDTAKANLTRIK